MSDFIRHELIQGTPEWHAFRAQHFNASDAPAMMGKSKYKTRAQLLHEKATGITEEVDAATQRRFDDGHRFEALARPLAEAIIGDDLYPVVGSRGKFGASFDGLTMLCEINFEHKTLNAGIAACATADDLDEDYHIQVQHQMMVSAAERTLFMASRWDENDELVEKVEFWIERDEKLIAEIKAGWVQFEIDRDNYVAPVIAEKPKGEAVLDLPAVMVKVSGDIAITDNLDKFTTALKTFVDEKLIKKPESDQDFADLDNQIKTLKKAEEALDSAESHMLAQVDSVDTAKRMIDLARNLARENRLIAEKLVKNEKERIKTDRIMLTRTKFMDHISALNAEISPVKIEGVAPDFNGAAKNKRTLSSLYDALDTELARVKIEADAQAKDIRANLATLGEHAEYRFLFNDVATIAHKAPDDFAALVAHRIREHKEAEEARREQERQQMQRQAEAEARARVEAEQRAEAERIRQQEEANARAKVEAEKVAEYPEAALRGAQQLIDADEVPSQETIDLAQSPESEKLHITTIVIEHWYSDGLVLANLRQLLEERGFPVKSVRVAEQEVEA